MAELEELDDFEQMLEDNDTNSQLIKMISTFPIFFDKSLEDYKNVIKKQKIWRSIASEINSKLYIQLSGKLII